MATARQIVELGRRVRTDTKMRTRQPLAEAVAHVSGHDPGVEALLPIVAEELNVHDVRLATSADAFGTWRAKPDFKALGPRLGSRVQAVAAALADDDGTLAETLAGRPARSRSSSTAGPWRSATTTSCLTRDVLAGWGVASDGGVTVALELELTPELRSEGLARELVRVAQDARRAAGLAVQRSDRPAGSSRRASSPTRGMHTRRSSRARRSRPSCGPMPPEDADASFDGPRSTGCPSRSRCVGPRPTSGLRPRRASSARGRRRPDRDRPPGVVAGCGTSITTVSSPVPLPWARPPR